MRVNRLRHSYDHIFVRMLWVNEKSYWYKNNHTERFCFIIDNWSIIDRFICWSHNMVTAAPQTARWNAGSFPCASTIYSRTSCKGLKQQKNAEISECLSIFLAPCTEFWQLLFKLNQRKWAELLGKRGSPVYRPIPFHLLTTLKI